MNNLRERCAAGWRHHLWLALLVAASFVCTFGLACAVPFAAFGAIAAMTLHRRDALLLTAALWLINQIVGFTVLHYPWDGMTLAWGAILGIIAVLSMLAAQIAIRGQRVVTTVIAGLAAAFVVYEGGLYLVAATVMGGTEDFAAAIIIRIFALNAGALAVLLTAGFLIAAAGSRDRTGVHAALTVARGK